MTPNPTGISNNNPNKNDNIINSNNYIVQSNTEGSGESKNKNVKSNNNNINTDCNIPNTNCNSANQRPLNPSVLRGRNFRRKNNPPIFTISDRLDDNETINMSKGKVDNDDDKVFQHNLKAASALKHRKRPPSLSPSSDSRTSIGDREKDKLLDFGDMSKAVAAAGDLKIVTNYNKNRGWESSSSSSGADADAGDTSGKEESDREKDKKKKKKKRKKKWKDDFRVSSTYSSRLTLYQH